MIPQNLLRCSGVSSKIVDVNCGTYATFATTADGHIFAFGLNNYGQLALPGGDSRVLCVCYGFFLGSPRLSPLQMQLMLAPIQNFHLVSFLGVAACAALLAVCSLFCILMGRLSGFPACRPGASVCTHPCEGARGQGCGACAQRAAPHAGAHQAGWVLWLDTPGWLLVVLARCLNDQAWWTAAAHSIDEC